MDNPFDLFIIAKIFDLAGSGNEFTRLSSVNPLLLELLEIGAWKLFFGFSYMGSSLKVYPVEMLVGLL